MQKNEGECQAMPSSTSSAGQTRHTCILHHQDWSPSRPLWQAVSNQRPIIPRLQYVHEVHALQYSLVLMLVVCAHHSTTWRHSAIPSLLTSEEIPKGTFLEGEVTSKQHSLDLLFRSLSGIVLNHSSSASSWSATIMEIWPCCM